MATQVQLRRDTAADLVSVPPAQAEPGYDQTNGRLLVGDGVRNQGIPHASFFDVHKQTFIAGVAGGTANALTLDITDGVLGYNPVGYAKFQRFVFEAAADNSGATTLAVGGLTAQAIKKYDAGGSKAALSGGEIVDGALYTVTHDGVDFLLGSAAGAGGGLGLIGFGRADYATRSSHSTTIPIDTTVPQSSEGEQILSLAYTPVSAASTLRLRALVSHSLAAAAHACAALFETAASANALAVAWNYHPAAGEGKIASISADIASTGTVARTFTVRVGANGQTVYVNGGSADSWYGAALFSSLTLEELLA